MAHHGGVLPVGGTFFVFSDYMRGAVRLAALSRAHVIYSWTHDSVGLGEDGPTHQPVEHLASLRAMPGLEVVRPADANECAQAWRVAVDGDGPTALVLTRQGMPVLAETAERAADGRGPGRVRAGRTRSTAPPDVVLVGDRQRGPRLRRRRPALLAGRGIRARVVSLPCWERFEAQDRRRTGRTVLPAGRPPAGASRPATSFGWERYADATRVDRHLRGLGPGRGGPGQVRLHPRARGRLRPGAAGRGHVLRARPRSKGSTAPPRAPGPEG